LNNYSAKYFAFARTALNAGIITEMEGAIKTFLD